MSGKLLFKVPLVGAFAVGKTSLVRRFVESVFDEKYLTTVGVKIDRKSLTVETREVTLVIWDIAGEDAFQQVESAYVRGAAGLLLVADGTRPATCDKALELDERLRAEIGEVPRLLLVNKCDLADQWRLEDDHEGEALARGLRPRPTSARDGSGVESAFQDLARALVAAREAKS